MTSENVIFTELIHFEA